MTNLKEENREYVIENRDSRLMLALKLLAIAVIMGIGWFVLNILMMLPVGVGG